MWSWRAVLLKNSCSSEGPTVQMLHKAIKIAEIELNWLLAKQLYLTEQKRSQSWKWNIPGNVRGLLWYLGQEALVREIHIVCIGDVKIAFHFLVLLVAICLQHLLLRCEICLLQSIILKAVRYLIIFYFALYVCVPPWKKGLLRGLWAE